MALILRIFRADYCQACGKAVWCKCGLCLICHPHGPH